MSHNSTLSLHLVSLSLLPISLYPPPLSLLCAHSLPLPQAGLTVRAVQKYLLGTDMTLFTSEHMDGSAPAQPYPSNSPGGTTTGTGTAGSAGVEGAADTYQNPPFTENNAAPTYQVPIY